MKQKLTFALSVALCATLGLLSAYLIFSYGKELKTRKDQAFEFGQQQASVVQVKINNEFQAQMDVVDAVAADLTSGALPYPEMAGRLREEVNKKSNIFGLGAAFEPYRYKSGVKLFGPYYRKDDTGAFIRTQTEEFYDYSDGADPTNAWYVETIQKGQPGWFVYFDKNAGTTLVEYAAPFFARDPQTGSNVAVGVIYIDHSVDTIKEFMRAIDVGEEGYTVLISNDGKYIVHPQTTLLNQTVESVSKELGMPILFQDIERAIDGEDFWSVGQDISSQQAVWRYYKPLVAPGWVAATVIKQDSNKPVAEENIRALLNMGMVVLAFLFFLSAVLMRAERGTLRSLWRVSISATVLLIVGVIWVWIVANNNPLRNLEENVLVNPENVDTILGPVEQDIKLYARGDFVRIPTGIIIKTLTVDPSSAAMSGYLWQKYPVSLSQDVNRCVKFPDDLGGASIEEVYRFTKGNTETIGWFFTVTSKQAFNLSKYPLDQANVELKIWPCGLDDNLIPVPDFVSYEFMAPSEKPGLASSLTLNDWTINRSYFSFVPETYNADMGSAPILQRNQLPSLAFNINATRNLLSPLIAYIITALVVSSMLFGIQLVDIETPFNALSNASALFFVVAITHVSLRGALNASGVVYLEYVFIVQYIYILVGAVNGMLYYGTKKDDWVHYENNLITKIVYWPAFLSMLLIISLLIFYPAKVTAVNILESSQSSNLNPATEAATAVPDVATPLPVMINTPASENAQAVPSKEIVITTDTVTLRYPIYANPATLDPSQSNRYDSTEQIGNLFMGLTRLEPATLEVQPWLAETWTPSADGLVWTFILRNDIPWVQYDPAEDGSGGMASQVTDFQGKPRFVSSEDIVFGLTRALTTQNPSAQLLFVVENAEAVYKGELPPEQLGVRALDATTIQFTLTGQAPYFPELLSYDITYPLPSWAIEDWAEDWTDTGKINTNGPYMLSAYEKDQRLQLVKNPLWPDADKVQIELINEAIISDPQEVINLYLNNELDTIGNPSSDLLEAIKSNALITPDLSTYTKLCTQYIGFTNTKAPLDDPRVRRALSAAIDRDFIATQVLKNGSLGATVFSPPGVFGAVTEPGAGQGYDPKAAKTLLDDYLTERGLTVSEFNTAYKLSFGQLSTGAPVNQAIIDNWRKVLGVTVTLTTAPNDDLSPYDRKNVPLDKAFHMFQGNWCADYPDQDNFIRFLFNSQTGSNNIRRNCADAICQSTNPPTEFDKLTNAASNTTNPAERVAYYAQAEQVLAVDEAAYAPVFFDAGAAVTRPWLTRNFPALGAPDFYEWKIDGSAQVKP